MESTIVTSKGQITIPKEIRQQLGIRKGSKIEFIVVEDHVEMYLANPSEKPSNSGFGMLKSSRSAIPADFDPASLLAADAEE
jgi:AbrB family looped-hinge helix DNA binding protein